ncbi:MAG: ammonia-forming cytochrome c nitrite reductase subunit c552, partial [Sedimentisphaerales bacterium]|nr:ammonia-forming cytochrome c nitrite reductase subunit c552 [Sedimentisphaerales bacterium]
MTRPAKTALIIGLALAACGLLLIWIAALRPRITQETRVDTSASCTSCHQQFYQLWSTSWHGLTVRPFSGELAGMLLSEDGLPIALGNAKYMAIVDPNNPNKGMVIEHGPQGMRVYPIKYIVGGKDICYLLTELDRGRLQVLPIAYDVRRRQWYATTESMVRHAPGLDDAPLDWKDPALTFNNSCYCCHVSQIRPNYDPQADTFSTTWAEPGITCQACHGPGTGHIEACRTSKGRRPKDLQITVVSRSRGYSAIQVNSACGYCHAKISPITGQPCLGDELFDHYDIATLEDPDFLPDGRDLGENFTYTQWLMSPCARSGQLDCLHCHTPSGRYRFADPQEAHMACMPCHNEKLKQGSSHTHHDWPGGPTCTSCHMPTTEFARIRRSDHSMRPPMPAATMAFGSPNACNICHADKDPNWANEQVRSWHKQDYQAKTIHVASLIWDARRRDWQRLEYMLDYIQKPDRDEVFASSLIRLLADCPDGRKIDVLLERLRFDPSALVRSSAARVLSTSLSPAVISGLAKATADSVRLVRFRAAEALCRVPVEQIPPGFRRTVERSIDEYTRCLAAQPHRPQSQYNLANVLMDNGDYQRALRHFIYAIQLRPDYLPAIVNAALCFDQLGRPAESESMLRRAISIDPNSIPANLNLALLLGQQGRLDQAARQFQAVLELDPNNAIALYNLAEILRQDRPTQTLELYRRAVALCPSEGRYVC